MPSADLVVEQAGGRSPLVRFLLFCAVGGSGMVVDFGSFHLLRFLGLTHTVALGSFGIAHVANMLSVALAIQWNFYLNWRWTFADRGTPMLDALWRFNLFCSATWLLNQIVVTLLEGVYSGPVTAAGITFEAVNLWKVVAIGVCTFANFFLSTKLAFKPTAK